MRYLQGWASLTGRTLEDTNPILRILSMPLSTAQTVKSQPPIQAQIHTHTHTQVRVQQAPLQADPGSTNESAGSYLCPFCCLDLSAWNLTARANHVSSCTDIDPALLEDEQEKVTANVTADTIVPAANVTAATRAVIAIPTSFQGKNTDTARGGLTSHSRTESSLPMKHSGGTTYNIRTDARTFVSRPDAAVQGERHEAMQTLSNSRSAFQSGKSNTSTSNIRSGATAVTASVPTRHAPTPPAFSAPPASASLSSCPLCSEIFPAEWTLQQRKTHISQCSDF